MLPPCYETGNAIAIWYHRIKGESYVKTCDNFIFHRSEKNLTGLVDFNLVYQMH